MESLKSFTTGFSLIISLLLLGSCTDERTESEMLDSAKSFLESKDQRSASIELRNTLKKNTNNAEARYLLGIVNYNNNNLAGAEKEFKRALQAGWDASQAYLELARTLLANNEYQKLLDEVKVDDNWPLSYRADTLALRSLAHEALGDHAAAAATVKNSLELDENSLFALMAAARLQMSGAYEGDPSQTINRALSLYPDNLQLLTLHATNDVLNSNNDRAIETLKKVIASEDPGNISRQGRNARIELALIYMTLDNYQAAEKLLSFLLKKDYRDPIPNYLSSLIAFSQGDYIKAELHMRNLLKLAPGHNQSQHLMGNIKYALQDFGQAANHFTASLNETPDKLTVYKLLTRTYFELKNYDLARTTINSAINIAPDDAESINLLSQLKFLTGDTSGGIDTIEAALEKDPDNPLLIRQLAYLYIEAGNADNAFPLINNYQRLSNDIDEAVRLTVRTHLVSGDIASAISLSEKHLTENPDNPDNHALVGNVYANNKKYKIAREHFNDAIALRPNHPPALLGLAQIEDVQDNFDAAITLYKNYAVDNLTDITPIIALADIAKRQGQTDDMLHWLQDARDRFPGDMISRRALARYYLSNSQPGNATKYIQEALTISPGDNESLFIYSKILITQDRPHEAAALLKKLLASTPDDPEAHTLLGKLFLDMGVTDSAREHLLTTLKIDDDSALAISLLAEVEFKAQNLEKSLEYVKRLQSIDPDHHISYLKEGDVWLAKQEYEKAQMAFERSWQIKRTAEAARKLFSVIIHHGSFDDATKPLLAWLQNNPDDRSSRFYLAYAYQSNDRSNLAIEEYETMLKTSPNDSTLLNNLAWLYPLDGAKALDYAEKAYRSSPDDAGILDTYGWILTQNGHLRNGRTHLKIAIQKLPDNDEVNYHYGANLILSGEVGKGREIIERLVKSNRPFSGKQDAIKLLEKYSKNI